MRIAPLCLLLAGCHTTDMRLSDCMFGAATEAMAYECAVRNFGAKGAHYLREREQQCAIAGDPAWLAVNCRTSKAEEPNPIATALSKG